MLGFTDTVREEYRGTGVAFSSVLPTLKNTELGSGVAAPKGLPAAEPEEIAAVVVRLIGKPRAKARVTRAAGAMSKFVYLLPQSAGDAVGRSMGSAQAFLDDVDAESASPYEERVRHD